MNFRHLQFLVISSLILGWMSNSFASNWRAPQNYVPETDTFASYVEASFTQKMWENDHVGILKEMKDKVELWESHDEYLSNYGLEDMSNEVPLTTEQKRRQLEKGFLKYLDKRVMHKVKTAPSKSSLASVNSARKALRPSSTAEISKNFKIKFRAKILRGRGSLLFINPWVDANAQFSLSGKVEFNLRKEFQEPQILTEVRVNAHEGHWTALMQKGFSESIKAQVLSIQPTKTMAFHNDADRRIQLIFNKNF